MMRMAASYSRERDASQCEKATNKRVDAMSTSISSGIATMPIASRTKNGPTTIATLDNKTSQASGCAKLIVQPIH